MQAAVPSMMAAAAPGVTRAASTPSSRAIRSPLRSSRSVMRTKLRFISSIAAQTRGESREPPRSV
jgi:hypothetical protein